MNPLRTTNNRSRVRGRVMHDGQVYRYGEAIQYMLDIPHTGTTDRIYLASNIKNTITLRGEALAYTKRSSEARRSLIIDQLPPLARESQHSRPVSSAVHDNHERMVTGEESLACSDDRTLQSETTTHDYIHNTTFIAIQRVRLIRMLLDGADDGTSRAGSETVSSRSRTLATHENF